MSTTQCRIRTATLADAEAVFPIAVEFATSFTPVRTSFDASFRDVFAESSARLLVPNKAARSSAICSASTIPRFLRTDALHGSKKLPFIVPLRGRGVGRALMRDFEAWAVSRASKLVGLATRRAAPFYRSLGYEESASYFRRLISATEARGDV